MKSTKLWMLAAIICGQVLFTITSCSGNNDNIVPTPDPESVWPEVTDYTMWMKYLPDSRLVTDLSLPGAHDAVTAEGWNNEMMAQFGDMMAKCQDLTIQQLLEAGVRVFDLRPERVSTADFTYELRCSHGMMSTKLLVVDFFRKLQTWLAQHPSEFCILTVQLSATNDKKAWGQEFNTLITSDEFKTLFTNFKPRLTVGEMRGHVLMLSKEVYAEKPLGGFCYDWSEELDFEKQTKGRITGPDGSEAPLWVQDYWGKDNRTGKDEAVVKMLEAAATRDMSAATPAWVINFPSAYFGGFISMSDYYRDNATFANVVTINWLAEHKGSVGIIYMDFAGVDQSKGYDGKLYETAGKKLVESVVLQNKKQ